MGNKTTYQYDGAGRMTAKLQGGYTTSYLYDSLGRLSKTVTQESVDVQEYDYLDRVIEERTEDHSGKIFKKKQYAYDINGNQISQRVYRDSEHYAESRTIYNSENLPLALIDPLGNETNIVYHYTDHIEKEIIDPHGTREIQFYDQLNRLQCVKKYTSNGTLISYYSLLFDGRGNPILHHERNLYNDQDFGIYAISALYDGMGQKTAETEQDEKTTTYTYANGKLQTITKPDGVMLTHTYDPFGRLHELFSSDGTIHDRYSYDLNDQLTVAEDLVHKTQTKRSYDLLNRLVCEKQATGFEISYSYDALDRVKEMRFQDGKLAYAYSPTTLISASRYKEGALLYTFSQQTDWRGKPTHQILPNGTNCTYQWDAMGRCIAIQSAHYTQSLTYDALGNLISTHDTSYSYDPLNQIIEETGPLSNRYAFDSLYNRRKKNGIAIPINALNQPTNGLVYDKNGNRIAKNNTPYSYDALGRLITCGQITYQYDPFGRRIIRSSPNSTVNYLYQSDTEIGSTQNGTLKEFRAIYGEFAPFAIELNEVVYTPIRNHRGDICVLLNKQGNPVSIYRYSAFGEFVQDGEVASPWLFSGQRYDFDTQLFHFAKREYDPTIGRWLTPDPLGFADGPNLYAYVHNNPLIYVDPYGLWRTQLKDFCSGCTRGVVDDTTFGATEYMLGQYQKTTFSSKLGYYSGTGCSLAAGLLYGGTWLKGARYGGKAATYAYKFTRSALSGTRATKNALEARNIVKLAQETKPLLQKISEYVSRHAVNFSKKTVSIKRNFINSNGFFGKSGWELKNAKYQCVRNSSAKVNNYNYTGHALDQMQNRGVVPSIIENTVRNGRVFPTRYGTIGFFDPINKVRVIKDTKSGRIITVIRGGPN